MLTLRNTKSERNNFEVMKISKLTDYTHVEVEEFLEHFLKNLERVRYSTSKRMINLLTNFDRLPEKEKYEVIEFVENPDYGTFKWKIQTLFNRLAYKIHGL